MPAKNGDDAFKRDVEDAIPYAVSSEAKIESGVGFIMFKVLLGQSKGSVWKRWAIIARYGGAGFTTFGFCFS